MELGYARVSAAKQDLDRQIEALAEAGLARERIYVDNKSGATVERPGLRAVLAYAALSLGCCPQPQGSGPTRWRLARRV